MEFDDEKIYPERPLAPFIKSQNIILDSPSSIRRVDLFLSSLPSKLLCVVQAAVLISIVQNHRESKKYRFLYHISETVDVKSVNNSVFSITSSEIDSYSLCESVPSIKSNPIVPIPSNYSLSPSCSLSNLSLSSSSSSSCWKSNFELSTSNDDEILDTIDAHEDTCCQVVKQKLAQQEPCNDVTISHEIVDDRIVVSNNVLPSKFLQFEFVSFDHVERIWNSFQYPDETETETETATAIVIEDAPLFLPEKSNFSGIFQFARKYVDSFETDETQSHDSHLYSLENSSRQYSLESLFSFEDSTKDCTKNRSISSHDGITKELSRQDCIDDECENYLSVVESSDSSKYSSCSSTRSNMDIFNPQFSSSTSSIFNSNHSIAESLPLSSNCDLSAIFSISSFSSDNSMDIIG